MFGLHVLCVSKGARSPRMRTAGIVILCLATVIARGDQASTLPVEIHAGAAAAYTDGDRLPVLMLALATMQTLRLQQQQQRAHTTHRTNDGDACVCNCGGSNCSYARDSIMGNSRSKGGPQGAPGSQAATGTRQGGGHNIKYGCVCKSIACVVLQSRSRLSIGRAREGCQYARNAQGHQGQPSGIEGWRHDGAKTLRSNTCTTVACDCPCIRPDFSICSTTIHNNTYISQDCLDTTSQTAAGFNDLGVQHASGVSLHFMQQAGRTPQSAGFCIHRACKGSKVCHPHMHAISSIKHWLSRTYDH